MDNVIAKSTFPSTKSEYLAALYMQNQDLTGMSPEDLATMYAKAYKAINITLRKQAAV